MLASRRWRDWKPQIIENCTDCELTEPTEPAFVSSVSASMAGSPIIFTSADLCLQESPTLPERINGYEEWREPLARWMDSDCIRHWRLHESVGSLHVAFAEWAVGQGIAPCTRSTLEKLLLDQGWEITAELKLVAGLMLRRSLRESGYYPELLSRRDK